ncbi:discoidin domain-containing protein [Actinoplanes sp. NPDC049681]|uniref:discoidin domain-containing protein n=1 Tax=Actinoplanes sp. NPDC049681 TaxID=3363905 RepID=UPI0037AA4392
MVARWKSFIGTGAVAALAVAGGVVLAHSAEAAETLLTAGRPATASSTEGAGFEPGKAVDGNTSTRWASKEGGGEQWIAVDLGRTATVTELRVVWEAAYAKAYRFEVSDDSLTWTRVWSTSAGDGGVDTKSGLTATGRYVRILAQERATGYGYSMFEFEAYGSIATPPPSSPSPTASSPPPGGGDAEPFTAIAVGDVAVDPDKKPGDSAEEAVLKKCKTPTASDCAHKLTSDRALAENPDLVLVMGDAQYDDSNLTLYNSYYDKTWGRLKSRTRAVVGNHDLYDDEGYDGFKAYFGSKGTGPGGTTWYSFDKENWHFIAIDSNFIEDEGGDVDSKKQLEWLKRDLAATTKSCIAAFAHHPRFSSGDHGNNSGMKPYWDALYAARADLFLNGHDHSYERLGPQDPNGRATTDGIVELVNGAGGAPFYDPGDASAPNSQKTVYGKLGVVKLQFGVNTFRWDFLPTGTSQTPLDRSPTYTCH